MINAFQILKNSTLTITPVGVLNSKRLAVVVDSHEELGTKYFESVTEIVKRDIEGQSVITVQMLVDICEEFGKLKCITLEDGQLLCIWENVKWGDEIEAYYMRELVL